MVLIKGTGRGRCNCGTPTELEMQNIRDASEEAVREAREALRIAGETQDTLDDIMDGTVAVPEASIATNLPYSAKRITGSPNDFYVFRYGKIVLVKINGITLTKNVTSTFGVGEFPHPLYDSTISGYASTEGLDRLRTLQSQEGNVCFVWLHML